MTMAFDLSLCRHSLRSVVSAVWCGLLLTGVANAAEFETLDALRAFVHAEYPLGEDYFINGVQDTILFRCNLTKDLESFEGVAFSEISIWGNRTGRGKCSESNQMENTCM